MLASSFPSYPMRSHCIPNVLGVNPRRAKSEVIEYLVKMGVIVICAGGGGIPTTYRPGDSLIAAETVIDKDRADALLARELKADVLCWLLVASVGPNWPVRTPHAVSCSLPIPERKRTISSMHLLILTTGEWTLCRGFSPSSRG
jgi:hypothetical protein